MRTYSLKKENVHRDWWVIDVKDKPLGRVASRIASILRGKHKVDFTPHVDNGDFIIVLNADKIMLTGKKEEQKVYRHHSGYIGNLKEVSFLKKKEKNPEGIIIHAVSGMLPKNKLGRKMVKKLKVYRGEKHPHQAQKLKVLDF
ncbi:MAG: 50S ribosomal protein L13 [Candidatus Stahlbacteria bacterium]|jgi:large subunit ribosomal protein L13|nr:50S ribosomal protein L13 [candidate division WOR-3 bacterium]TEU00492.1 MAG: 50S ribosomal protein L13 [Candidatus Stahlbacteria bacterium]